MNINLKRGDELRRYQLPKSVEILVHVILGVLLSIAFMSALILAQIVIYLCSVIARVL
jgi:hypothetical protein